MKKVTLLFLCILLIFQMCSCATIVPQHGEQVNIKGQLFDEIQMIRAKGSTGYQYRSQTHQRAQLTSDAEDRLYVQIGNAASRISRTQDSDGRYPLPPILMQGEVMQEEEILKTVNAFQRDNPQIFWIAGIFRFYYKGDDTVIELSSQLSPEECGRSIWRLNTRINELFAGLPDNANEFDRELFLYDRLLSACTYDSVENKVHKNWKSYTAYGALVDGLAVCEGYSRSMQLLLSYAGMECSLVTGAADGSPHMWNLVSVDGSWYHLDPTWDDTGAVGRHTYFNLNEKTISLTHKLNPLYENTVQQDEKDGQPAEQLYNLFLPACDDMDQNYYSQKAVMMHERLPAVSQNDNSALKEAMSKLPSDGPSELTFQFLVGKISRESISLFLSLQYGAFSVCLDEENKMRESDEMLWVEQSSIDPLQKNVLVVVVSPIKDKKKVGS